MTSFFCWIFLYVMLPKVSTAFTIPLWVLPMVYTPCLAVWFFRKTVYRNRPTMHTVAVALPLFVFAVANALFLQSFDVSVAWICALIGAVAEEILFRGLLVQALEKYNVHIAVWGSAVLFAAYHVINGGYLQGACAFCFGFALAVFVCRYRSIWPCIAVHLLTNVFSGGNVPVWVLLLCCVICSIYGWVLYPRKKEN